MGYRGGYPYIKYGGGGYIGGTQYIPQFAPSIEYIFPCDGFLSHDKLFPGKCIILRKFGGSPLSPFENDFPCDEFGIGRAWHGHGSIGKMGKWENGKMGLISHGPGTRFFVFHALVC